MRTSRFVASVVVLAMCPVSALHAQPAKNKAAPAAPSASSAAPLAVVPTPDVVRMKSGAFFRGTLVEHDPKGRTVLQTATGTKDLDGAEVAYAGPIAGDPGAGGTAPAPTAAPPPPVVPVPPTANAPVELRSNLPGTQFHLLRSRDVLVVGGQTMHGGLEAANFQLLCVAPCSVPLAPGTYRFGLAHGDSPPIAAEAPVEVKQGSVVEGTVTSHAPRRKTGTLLLVGAAGLVAGSLLVPFAISEPGDRTGSLKYSLALIAAGGVLGVVGLTMYRDADVVSVRSAAADLPVTRPALGPLAGEPRPLGTSFGGQF